MLESLKVLMCLNQSFLNVAFVELLDSAWGCQRSYERPWYKRIQWTLFFFNGSTEKYHLWPKIALVVIIRLLNVLTDHSNIIWSIDIICMHGFLELLMLFQGSLQDKKLCESLIFMNIFVFYVIFMERVVFYVISMESFFFVIYFCCCSIFLFMWSTWRVFSLIYISVVVLYLFFVIYLESFLFDIYIFVVLYFFFCVRIKHENV